ncbi:hypothetical protein V6N13_027108 [Hibiscus sabdariffa]|uniref:Uncharacterized protein n=2 Tax=Hibiscus sabdariffa TaxID=183260 RepID=A0ABR2A4J2_9ROSI
MDMGNTVGELNAGPTGRGNQTKSNQLQGAGENPEAGLRQVGDVRGSQGQQLGSENVLQQKLEMWAWLVTEVLPFHVFSYHNQINNSLCCSSSSSVM